MKPIKHLIEQKLENMELDEVALLITEYEKEAPKDMDILIYKTIYHIYNNELDLALQYALKGVQSYPVNGDMYYNLAYIYEMGNDLLLAVQNYTKAQSIYQHIQDTKEKMTGEKIEALLEEIADYALDNKIKPDVLNDFLERFDDGFDFKGNSTPYKNNKQVIGHYIWTSTNEKKYVGIQKPLFSDFVLKDAWDLAHSKGEILSVDEGLNYRVSDSHMEYLLPIAVKNKNTMHLFKMDDTKYVVQQKENRHFNYYRVKAGTLIASSGVSYYGKPIPLGHDSKRKKLVLNIFVDGLSGEIIKDGEFERLMPNTFSFFKEGTICTQAYSTADWTFPSLSTYVTGLDTPHHMMYHNIFNTKLPEDVPTLAEYFKGMGYITTKMDGDWRSVPTNGHDRGYDRYIYQNQVLGSKGEAMIGDIIEQLEGLKDADNFMWVCMGDLHDVSDGFDLSFGVQGHIGMEDRVIDQKGETSVRQDYSVHKINNYKKMASYIDVLLGSLYNYILNNYNEEEFIVSLFADHGQGYLVPEGGHFISKERTKVAFMFRGGCEKQVSDEIISTSDYVTIMNKLAGIPMKNIKTMGNLPVCFGGETEREYALSETIFPKGGYFATFYTKEHTIYFENGVPTGEDGRFELKDYHMEITDLEGNLVEDDEIANKYMDIIMEHVAALLIY